MEKSIIICFAFFTTLNSMYASDTRFAGMGNLSLLFHDDFHKLDLYDFGGISAGFFRNDSVSTTAFRASVLKESWARDSVVFLAIGQAIPRQLIAYAPVEAVSFYEIIPQFNLIPCEIIYASRHMEATYDGFGNEIKPKSWGIHAGYSQLNREFEATDESDAIRTPSFRLIYAKPFTDRFDYGISADGFYGAYKLPLDVGSITLMPIGGGSGLSYNGNIVNFGLNADYHYSIFTYDSPFGTERFGGHAISPAFGSVVKSGAITWCSAFDYKFVRLNGSYEGQDMGHVQINGYSTKTQLHFTPHVLNLTVFLQHDNVRPAYVDASGSTWFETTYKSYDFGSGIGVKINRLSAGIEGLLSRFFAEDIVATNEIRSSNLSIKCGAEFAATDRFYLRAGYNYNEYDPDLDDIVDASDLTTANTFTAGLGIHFLKNTRIDCAYNYKQAYTNSDLQNPDETITDHIIFLYFKRIMVQEYF